MKIRYTILLLLSLFIFQSCNDWLDVDPRTQQKVDKMFASQKGYQDALTGVYLELVHNESYGQFLTQSKIENLVNFWTTNAGSGEEALSLHNYKNDDAAAFIKRIYARQYKAILGANSILEHIEDNSEILSTGGYESIKGECLAIRALCHLDLLRLFGPVPGQEDNTPILTYMTTVSAELHPLDTYSTIKTKILDDLFLAEELLQKKKDMQDDITVDYYADQPVRINVFAVKSILAQAYLWFGEKQNANNYAWEVIHAAENVELGCSLGEASDMDEFDYMLTPEFIFALSRFDAYARYQALFEGHALYKGINESFIKNDIFESSGTDIRELNLWKQVIASNQAQYYITTKYFAFEDPGQFDRDLYFIPIIRLSEIYFIAVETGGATPENQALWDEFTTSRNIENVTLPTDNTELSNLLLKEYRKEFYAEGKAFYFYKRHNIQKDNFLWAQAQLNVNYVLPLPNTEVVQ
ncbi:MAG: RagB/SusD family nutrient uptake outer membrane protein [Draconibacterium sp.]